MKAYPKFRSSHIQLAGCRFSEAEPGFCEREARFFSSSNRHAARVDVRLADSKPYAKLTGQEP